MALVAERPREGAELGDVHAVVGSCGLLEAVDDTSDSHVLLPPRLYAQAFLHSVHRDLPLLFVLEPSAHHNQAVNFDLRPCLHSYNCAPADHPQRYKLTVRLHSVHQ